MTFIITSRTHALVITVYAIHVALGVAYLLGIAEARTMKILVGDRLADLWALIMVTAAITCLAAVFSVKERPMRALGFEMWAAFTLGFVSLAYEVTVAIGNGLTSVVTTQIYAVGFGLGFIAAACQIVWERREPRKRELQEVPDNREV